MHGHEVDVRLLFYQRLGTVSVMYVPVDDQHAADAKLGARSYLDLLATFKVKDNYSFRVGVNNVLDQDPPLTGANNCPAANCRRSSANKAREASSKCGRSPAIADMK